MRMVRFFDILNTRIAVLGLSIVVVVVNIFLYFGYYSSNMPPPPRTERTVPSATTLERTERAGPKERTQPATPLQSTTPTDQSVTVSATASP